MAACSDLGTEALTAPHSPGFMDDGEDGSNVVLPEEGGMEAGVYVSDEEAREDLGCGGFTHYKRRAREKDEESQQFPRTLELMLLPRRISLVSHLVSSTLI